MRFSIPLSAIEGASPSHWSVWAGIGWRTNSRATVGLIGTYVNIVEVRFREPQRVRMVLPFACRRLYVSLEEPREFIAALRDAGAAETPREPVAGGGGPGGGRAPPRPRPAGPLSPGGSSSRRTGRRWAPAPPGRRPSGRSAARRGPPRCQPPSGKPPRGDRRG